MNGTDLVNPSIKALIFNIQRYSLHDGPGIRTTVFFKGCPLRCQWCCNPESLKDHIEVGFIDTKCLYCGKCLQTCSKQEINTDIKNKESFKIDITKCNLCGDCIDKCPSEALYWLGREIDVEKLYENILADESFYRQSGGGVTFSGGEPLIQIHFLNEIIKKCYQGDINIAIETCGYVPWSHFEKIIDKTDLFLYDIKHIDNTQHKKITGVENKLIFENLKKLMDKNANIILRIPLIPGKTDDEKNIHGIGEYAQSLKIKNIHILPYHRLGKNKYKITNADYTLADTEDMATTESGKEKIQKSKNILESYSIKVTIGG